MNYYKDQSNQIFAYNDSQLGIVKEGLIAITEAEALEILKPTLEQKRQSATLTPMQFMLSVNGAGMMPAIEDYLALATTPINFKIMWNKAQVFERLYPDLVAAATELGITDAQLDAVFGIE